MSTYTGKSNVKVPTKRDLIVNTLAEQIEGGEYAPGEKLAGEKALASRFHVSRGTVREALSELQRRKLIETRGGVGSVVVYDGHAIDQSAGWTAALSDISRSVTTELLGIEVKARQDVPDLPLHVDGTDFVMVARLRSADGPDGTPHPVSFERSYVPNSGYLSTLPELGLHNDSLTASLARAGLQDARGEQIVSLHLLGPADAQTLQRPAGTPFLRTVRTSFTPNGQFVEHVVSLLDPVHFSVLSKFGVTR
ncbi:MAG: GntR family transcriptional regulator [Bifidobacteriaceae bacterium]|nr:GntR family transcriptional regulator [Bifidobacteriaceae bacterium]